MDKKEVLKHAPPYDGKKDCWVPDPKEGYVHGQIVSTKGDNVTVSLPDGVSG